MHFSTQGSLRSQKWMNFRKTSERPLTLSYISYNLYPKTYIPQYISHNLYPTIHIPQLISHRSPLAQRIRSDLKIVNVRLSLLKRRYSGVKSPQWTPPFQVLLLVPWKFTLRLHPYLVFTPSKMLDGCFASPLATKGTGPGLRVSEKLKKNQFFMPHLSLGNASQDHVWHGKTHHSQTQLKELLCPQGDQFSVDITPAWSLLLCKPHY